MFERDTDQDWKRYGAEDPYYGVVSNDEFHRENLTDEVRRQFFKTGDEHVDYILGQIRAHMAPGFFPRRVLDFGCGVGRCSIPFGKHSESVLGVDISEDMIEEAKQNANRLSAVNVKFMVSDADLSILNGSYDLIHSFIVFQHIPPRKGMRFIAKMIDHLDDDGVAVLHILYHAEISRAHMVARWLRKRAIPIHWIANVFYGKPWRYPLMEKNEYDLNRLFMLLRRKGCGNSIVRLTGAQTMHGIIIFCQKKADKIPYDQSN
jgi:2-polyprenyl-3-methyl-5-hydroxy-6-metoxy-1,4-benzoquinol methylase